MDIVFQSGEFYFEEISTLGDAIKDVGLPIVTLLLGIALPILYNRWQNRRRLIKLKEQLVFELEAIVSPLEKYANQLILFSKRILETKSSGMQMESLTNLSHLENKFSKYTSEDLVGIVEHTSKSRDKESLRKGLHNSMTLVGLIDKVVSVSNSKFTETIAEVNNRKGHIDSNILEIQEVLASYMVKANLSGNVNDQFLADCEDVFNKHSENSDPMEMYYARDSLITPLLGIAERHAPRDMRALQVLRPIRICNHEYQKIELSLQQVSRSYRGYGETLKEAHVNLISAISLILEEV